MTIGFDDLTDASGGFGGTLSPAAITG